MAWEDAVNVRSVDGSDVLVHDGPTYADNAKADLANRAAGGESVALYTRFATQSVTTDEDGNPA